MAIYTDINLTSPEVKPQLIDVETIFQSIEMILSTITGERFFNVEFGLDLEDFLFELMDELTELDLLSRVTSAVARFEQRVSIDFRQTMVRADTENNRYDIDLVFSIKGFDGQKFVFQDTITNNQLAGAA